MNEIEYDFLSELVAFPRNFAVLNGRFKAEYLSDELGQVIFQAMAELGDYELLSLRDKLDGIVDFQVLLDMNANVQFMPKQMFKCYAMKVFEDYREREIERLMMEGVNSSTMAKVIELENFDLFEVEENVSEDYLGKVEKKYAGEKDESIIPTGFEKLDDMIEGFVPSELVFLAGSTGSGKTTFAMNLAFAAAKMKKKVLFFSLEMKEIELHERLVKSLANVSNYATMNEQQFNKVVKISRSIKERLPLEINDKNITLEAMYSIIKDKQDVDMVFIDHLNILTTSERIKDKLERLEYLTRKLKEMAKDLNIPIICLCQLNRLNTDRPNKNPQLSDLRGSGSIEQDANLILFVYRPEYFLLQMKPDESSKDYLNWEDTYNKVRGKAKIIVAKNRRGRTGEVEMIFQGEFYKFVEC